MGEDGLREEVRRLLEEKSKCEASAKTSLQRVLEEKADTTSQLTQTQRSGAVGDLWMALDHNVMGSYSIITCNIKQICI